MNRRGPSPNPQPTTHNPQLSLPPPASQYDAVILAVAHTAFKDLDIPRLTKPNAVVFDVKSTLPKALIDGRL